MLRSCSYCGRIHDSKYQCPQKPKRFKERDEVHRFRTLQVWIKKRNYIRQRDTHLCQVCTRQLYDTHTQYTYDDIQVHHIVPLREDWERRLDEDNLLCLCRPHHEAAEAGGIPRAVLFAIATEQNTK
ncbi:HNH endonuclease [Ectobacillus ponti]|uniref:HNH endonuclease n=1 Tax=Ectobacillus ponti TaxID=2961894 RepID=A0AA41XBA0_9BACI|nr:HNH endonuclease signature motif containing protein [Ectobacillus ponti]MCP8969713.1 HNH endonuclease [Ectobacillus ponti]